jgi:hypothetical protein
LPLAGEASRVARVAGSRARGQGRKARAQRDMYTYVFPRPILGLVALSQVAVRLMREGK